MDVQPNYQGLADFIVKEIRKKDKQISDLRQRNEELDDLLAEASEVMDDLCTKTDVYLGVNEAMGRMAKWEKDLAALREQGESDGR